MWLPVPHATSSRELPRLVFVFPDYAMDLLGFFLVVLVRVDLIVVFDRLAIHETISSINGA